MRDSNPPPMYIHRTRQLPKAIFDVISENGGAFLRKKIKWRSLVEDRKFRRFLAENHNEKIVFFLFFNIRFVITEAGPLSSGIIDLSICSILEKHSDIGLLYILVQERSLMRSHGSKLLTTIYIDSSKHFVIPAVNNFIL